MNQEDLKAKGKVVVTWLMGGQSTPGFVQSIAALVAVSPQLGIDLLGAIPKVSGPRIADARNATVKHFLATPAEWLFMVDDDMVFEPDSLARLLKTADRYKRPIVGGFAYAAGRDGFFSTIWMEQNGHPIRVDDFPPDRLVKVVGTGAACLLVHRRVFEKIGEKWGDTAWPWFEETSRGKRTVGEDFTFCVRAGEAGFPIHVDTGVEFGHEKLATIDREFVANWRRTHRVVVTGTGRCGLGYVAKVMNQAAIPATHEGVYTADGAKPWGWQRVECSRHAVGDLGGFDGPVVHVVRHPLATVNSMVGAGWFDAEDAMRFYVDRNRAVEGRAAARFRIEDIQPDEFAAIAEAAGGKHSPTDMTSAIDSVPTNFNAGDPADLSWSDLPDGEAKTELEQLAKEYGYDV